MKKYEILSIEQLKEIIWTSLSKKEVCIKIGYKSGTKYNTIVDEISNKYNIDASHLSNKYIVNLLHQKFDKLIVEQFLGSGSNGYLWNCKCDCGNYIQAYSTDLNSQRIHQCAICARKQRGKTHRVDITNKIFGKLKAISINEEVTIKKNNGRTYWNCLCECGNLCIYSLSTLQRGDAISCGCTRSLGEVQTEKVLNELNISYKKEYTFKDLIGDTKPLRFDFAIFKDNILYGLIECQGQEHQMPISFWGGEEKFKKRIKYDKLKKDYCLLHKIPLYYIPYQDYNKIDKQYLYNLLNKMEEE